jgi:hypothetical protein
MLDSAELMQTPMEGSDDFIEWIVDEYTKNEIAARQRSRLWYGRTCPREATAPRAL